jgi:hypothetical protein
MQTLRQPAKSQKSREIRPFLANLNGGLPEKDRLHTNYRGFWRETTCSQRDGLLPAMLSFALDVAFPQHFVRPARAVAPCAGTGLPRAAAADRIAPPDHID